MNAPRVTPGGRRDVGILTWLLLRGAARVAGTAPTNLFLTLGRNRSLFRRWLVFAGALMPGGRLPRRETELVILRVAHLRDNAYERRQHLRVGRRAGLGDADFRRIEEGPAAPGWSPRERAILTAVDELHAGELTDAAWAGLRAHLDDRRLIELVMLAAHYEMLATTIAALRIQTEAR